jgi:hypothetical protein
VEGQRAIQRPISPGFAYKTMTKRDRGLKKGGHCSSIHGASRERRTLGNALLFRVLDPPRGADSQCDDRRYSCGDKTRKLRSQVSGKQNSDAESVAMSLNF